jgi:hypothetical protein
VLRRLRSLVWEEGASRFRGVRTPHDPAALVPGLLDTRFASLPGTAHVYLSATQTAALLESALHHVSGPDPTIYLAEVRDWGVAPVTLTVDLRLADLRDAELARLGIDRTALVDTDPLHHPCTRRWAAALQHRRVGGHPLAGAVWHSRQADLHARAHAGGVLGDLLTHRSIEVAVLWHPDGPSTPLRAGAPVPLLDGATSARLLTELSALLAAPIL